MHIPEPYAVTLSKSVYCHAVHLRGGADKFLAPPGRKQTTAPNSGCIQYTPHETQYTS